nr:MAG: wsv293a-like protein [Metapenaeopsis lamellata majanivirus]
MSDNNLISPENKTSILSDFNESTKFFIGPLFREVAYVIEEYKFNKFIEKMFMITIFTFIFFLFLMVSYRLKSQHDIMKKSNIKEDVI